MQIACRDVKSLAALAQRAGLACVKPRIIIRAISHTTIAWHAAPRAETQCDAGKRMRTPFSARTIMNARFMRRSRATPRAMRIPAQVSFGSSQWVDDFQWLQDPENPETIKYMAKENEYTSEMMSTTVPLQRELYQEMKARVYDTEDTVPEKYGDYWYYTRMGERDDFSIYCRKQGSMDNPNEEIMLDQNIESKNSPYIHVNVLKISNNHKMLAYTIDSEGMEQYTLKIKDIASGTLLEDTICPVVSVEWGDDNTIYYSVPDDKLRAARLYKHTLGTPVSSDILLYEETDDRFFIDITKTKDLKYVTLNSNSKTTSEIYIVEKTGDLTLVHKRAENIECFIEHYNDEFLLVTSAGGANNLKVVRVSDKDPREENWKDFIPEDPESRLEDMDIFTDYLILYERSFGLPRIRVVNMIDGSSHYVPLPEPVCTIYPGANLDYQSDVIRFAYSSPVTPEITYDYDLKHNKLTFLRALQLAGPSPFDASRIECKQVHVAGHDGTNIPLTIIHKLGLQKDQQNPVLLYGYGAYGHGLHPEFHLEWLSLIQRGWIIAQAHVRGGSELGKRWYIDGKQLKKKNSFHDYISCAEYLVNEKYTTPSKMAAMGSSAGGLIIGATANMRPDLFGGMIMKVPFVDVVTSMVDDSLPLTLHEYDEWGNPHDENVFKYIWEYDPYQNLKMKGEGPNGGYPPMLLVGSTMDSRCSVLSTDQTSIMVGGSLKPLISLAADRELREIYWHPLKYTAKMRQEFLKRNGEETGQKSSLLLRMNTESGHFGAGGRFGHLKEKAFEFAFLFKMLPAHNLSIVFSELSDTDIKSTQLTCKSWNAVASKVYLCKLKWGQWANGSAYDYDWHKMLSDNNSKNFIQISPIPSSLQTFWTPTIDAKITEDNISEIVNKQLQNSQNLIVTGITLFTVPKIGSIYQFLISQIQKKFGVPNVDSVKMDKYSIPNFEMHLTREIGSHGINGIRYTEIGPLFRKLIYWVCDEKMIEELDEKAEEIETKYKIHCIIAMGILNSVNWANFELSFFVFSEITNRLGYIWYVCHL